VCVIKSWLKELCVMNHYCVCKREREKDKDRKRRCNHGLCGANPTVRGIQQYSKQSFQPQHPGVSETPPLSIFFFYKFIGKISV
jgi:hypothetical protein